MPDDPNNAQDPNAAAGATPPAGGTPSPAAGQQPAPQVKTFTQEEVNQLVGRARDEGRQAALKKPGTTGQEQRTEGQATTAQPSVEELIQRSVQAALQQAGVDPFTQAAKAAGYSDAQVRLARAAADAAKPTDLSDWLAKWPAEVGLNIQPTSQAQPGTTPGAPRVAAPRKVDNLEQDGGFVDVFSLTDAQVEAMPIETIVGHFEKAKAAARAKTGAPPLPKALRK